MFKFSVHRKPRRGVSLIIVLASLVLLTILVLAFLAGIGSEVQTSKVYANGSSVKLLAQSAVSLVIAQIQTATADQTKAWASQPGMIRTYDNTGAAAGYYKLYSDATMQGTTSFTSTGSLVPTQWYNQKGIYVDLNQPVSVSGSNYYPIIDGNSSDYVSSYTNSTLSALNTPSVSGNLLSLGPLTNGQPAVTGFWISKDNAPTDPSSPNVAPMPVMWLYVLQNGSVLVPDSTTTNGQVTFTSTVNGTVRPTASNPIVGRIAYWTDDETCKVNVNTASDGKNTTGYGFTMPSGTGGNTQGTVNSGTMMSFWDTPRTNTMQDFGFAYSQPVQNEYQRYPGHPSTVALSAVFNGWSADSAFPENTYNLTPRVIPGGSQEGTVSTVNFQTISGTVTANLSGSLILRASRLYTTADEFLFQPSLASGLPGVGTRSLNSALLSSSSELTPNLLTTDRFFITACSEAPDVNLFNLPRVSMWPITLSSTTGAQAMTAYDQLIAFCGTINNSLYYFQRQDPNSPTVDLPTAASPTGVGRNRSLLEYLRALTSQPIPGFGGVFGPSSSGGTSKYTKADRNQILTEMFDYIRATNLQDSSQGATAYVQGFDLNGNVLTDPYIGNGLGQVVPIIDSSSSVTISDPVSGTGNPPRGFGRFPTVQQAALVFIGAGDYSTDPSPGSANFNPPHSYTPRVQSGYQRVQVGFFLQMFDPSNGLPTTRPRYIVTVNNLASLQWSYGATGTYSIFPGSTVSSGTVTGVVSFPYCYGTSGVYLQPTSIGINYSTFFGLNGGNGFPGFSSGGVIDFRQQSLLRDSTSGGTAMAAGHWNLPIYPYISPPTGQSVSGTLTGIAGIATLPDMPTGSTFRFSQVFKSDIQVQIYALASTWNSSTNTPTPTLLQTVNLNFPDADFPVPYSIHNNTVLTGPLYNIPPYTTNVDGSISTYHNIPSANSSFPAGAGSYLTSSGTTAPSASNVSFLSFLGSYGASSKIMGAGWGRLGFSSEAPWITTCDVVRAIVATPGDMRLIAARTNVPDTFYQPLTTTGTNSLPSAVDYYNPNNFYSHMLRFSFGAPWYGSAGGKLIANSTYKPADYQPQYLTRGTVNFYDSTGGNRTFINPADNDVPNQGSNVTSTGTIPGDWDTGMANTRDGAYINKADEGDTGNPAIAIGTPSDQNTTPYFEINFGNSTVGSTFFSPNRMIPSPGMFGSLPSQVWANKPWQTLLFRPGPAGHFGLGTPSSGIAGPPFSIPPDYLFMDLFNMPVVEPYAISTPLATAGRINMNYQIVPFNYINRDTGLRAVLKNQMVTAIANSTQGTYKSSGNVAGGTASTNNITTRFPINIDATLAQFLARFYNTSGFLGATGSADIFHSAAEICSIDLVPNISSYGSPVTTAMIADVTPPISRTNMDAYWALNSLTGDNVRERPYANIYPLLTTKSNTYTVHYRVQTLKQAQPPNADPTAWNTWREGTDVVVGEYRGSQTIERYIDPNDSIPDYADQSTGIAATFPPATPLSNFYKFRVVSTKQFAP